MLLDAMEVDVRMVLGALLRNRSVLRVVVGYAVFTVVEYSVWMAMLVYAYGQGGATEAGVVAVVQLVPAALVAPVAAVAADRDSPVTLLVAGFAAQALGMALAAAVILDGGPPVLAYAGAVIAATSVTTIRPAQAALLPALTREADELTAANVALAAVESVGIAAAGLLSAALLIRGPGAVFAASVVLITVAAWAVAPLSVARPATGASTETMSAWSSVIDGVKALSSAPGARPLVVMLGLQDVVLGGLDVLFVVLAISILHRSSSWVGYLNGSFGLGGILAGTVTFLLVGRRLPTPILLSSGVVGIGIALTGLTHSASLVVALLVLVGAARSVLDLATRTLLQRSVPAQIVGRVFGLVEGSTMVGLAIGSIIVSTLVALAGSRAALIGVGALLPAAALVTARWLRALDRETRVPVVEINLLKAIPMFAQLSPPGLEATARALDLRRLVNGETLLAEGEIGEHYYAIADGDLEVSRHGHVVRHCGRGTGVGEIALLRSVPRTATVTARADSLVYALDRHSFLVAITGHPAAHTVAIHAVDQLLVADRSEPQAR